MRPTRSRFPRSRGATPKSTMSSSPRRSLPCNVCSWRLQVPRYRASRVSYYGPSPRLRPRSPVRRVESIARPSTDTDNANSPRGRTVLRSLAIKPPAVSMSICYLTLARRPSVESMRSLQITVHSWDTLTRAAHQLKSQPSHISRRSRREQVARDGASSTHARPACEDTEATARIGARPPRECDSG